MIKLVAFDWNGTLLSDTQTVLNADNYALKTLGYKPVSLLKFRKSYDIPIINYWTNVGMEKSFFKKHMYEVEDLFHSHYEKHALRCRTRGGAREVLNWLYGQKIPSIIYSNHVAQRVEDQLERLKIKKIISKILGRSDLQESLIHSRSKQQKLHDFVKNHKFKPHEVISVGDTQEEIEIGKHLGYHTVAISGGYNSTARLKKHRPDFLIHNMKELITIIKKLNGK